MTYLDQGEYYSEFGSFDVNITLPANYVVGATGNLHNEQDKKLLDMLSEDTFEDFAVYRESDACFNPISLKSEFSNLIPSEFR